MKGGGGGGCGAFCLGVIFKMLIGFEESFLDKKALLGGHFKKFHESSIKISNENELGLRKKKKKKRLHF